MRRPAFILLLLLTACSGRVNPQLDDLDACLKNKDSFEAQKLDRIDRARHLLQRTVAPEARYEACMDLYDEYFSYQFDSSLSYLRQSQQLAREMNDSERLMRANIAVGYLYTVSGHFLEAYKSLYETVDSTRLSPDLERAYAQALFRFAQDLSGNSGMEETFNIPGKAYYRDRLEPLLTPDSYPWRSLWIDTFLDEGRLWEADSLSALLLASLDPHSHPYAIAAYTQSIISERLGRPEDRLSYLVQSAEADIENSVKDYASLTVIAQIVMNSDVDRAFRYLQRSQQDALFYNAKLRPWQISQFFMNIEQQYEARQQESRRGSLLAAVFMTILAALLAFVVWLLVQRTRKLSRLQALQAEANARLAEMNDEQLSYIARFLGYLSDNVARLRQDENRSRKLLKQGRSEELLKTLSSSTRAEDSLADFYRVFDNMFLGIFPDFVGEVNALLSSIPEKAKDSAPSSGFSP